MGQCDRFSLLPANVAAPANIGEPTVLTRVGNVPGIARSRRRVLVVVPAFGLPANVSVVQQAVDYCSSAGERNRHDPVPVEPHYRRPRAQPAQVSIRYRD